MQCPYCTTEINDAAYVCPQCSRDLYLFKPMLEKISALEEKLAAQEELVARLQVLESEEVQKEADAATPIAARPLGRTLLWLWCLPLALLLAAHVLLTIMYDANTLYLRILSLLIPLPFGLMLMRREARAFMPWLVSAFVLAACAVLGMSWLIALVDHTPVLPADLREWREFLEYAASIGFSYVTGMLLGNMLSAREASNLSGVAKKIAQTAGKHKQHAAQIQSLAEYLNKTGSTLMAIGTTALSIYTGLKGFLGGN